jgi:hypothetical protein
VVAQPEALGAIGGHAGGAAVAAQQRHHHFGGVAHRQQQPQGQVQLLSYLAPEWKQQGGARILDGPGALLLG